MKDYVDEVRALGEMFAVRAKAVVPCKRHEDVLENQYDTDANSYAYAMATNALKLKEYSVDRADLMDAIKTAIDQSADDCPRCQKDRDA